VLTDGDKAGQQYVEQARRFIRNEPEARRITALRERDIENCFYEHGYAAVFRRLAGEGADLMPTGRVIARAIDRHSKPMLALELVLAAAARGARGVPAPLAGMVETCVALARATPLR
jgi:putative ATP-dependent endonuclease of the OLD family